MTEDITNEQQQQAQVRAPSSSVSPILLSVHDLAGLLNISVRTVWRQDSAGQIPRPVRIGRTVRWFEEEIMAWVRAGCPTRKIWEASRRPRKRA